VGFVAQTGQPRIALDVDVDAAFFNNPDLPATRSEIALPLNVRGQTIGVLDVQSVEAGAFTKDDLNTLTVLADQVAIAIENARLFGQTEKALTEVQAVYRQYISQEWHGFASRNQNMGYRHTIQGGSKLDAEIQMPEIRAALEKGERPTTPSGSRNEASALTVPVKLRNQVIGVINVQAVKQGRDWSESEVDMVQAISERLALALENARLFEETARRAELERLSAELSGKIGSSIRLEAILQTTAQELSRALGGGTEVLVQIQPGNPDKPTDKLQAAK
jgi:GAF domain-containing protein